MKITVTGSATAILCTCIGTSLSSIGAFSPAHDVFENNRSKRQQLLPKTRHQSQITDAEIVSDENSSSDSSASSAANPPLNLIEYSQNQDPNWKNVPVAFCCNESNTYIDCRLVFYVKDPASSDKLPEYALGVPAETPIVVALEPENNGNANAHAGDARKGEGDTPLINLSKVVPISPDPDNNSEGAIFSEEEKQTIFELAARALKEGYGPSIRLKKTPRILTVEGGLEEKIGDWRKMLLRDKNVDEKKLSLEEAMAIIDADDDDDALFDEIMTRDLGPDYMNLVDDEDGIDKDILELFDAAGLDQGLDVDLSELEKEMNAQAEKIPITSFDQLLQQLQPSAALKLLSYPGPGEKTYTILLPLRPILLIGTDDPKSNTSRKIMLTEKEMQDILPRLESACLEDLEKAGFFLAGSGNLS